MLTGCNDQDLKTGVVKGGRQSASDALISIWARATNAVIYHAPHCATLLACPCKAYGALFIALHSPSVVQSRIQNLVWRLWALQDFDDRRTFDAPFRCKVDAHFLASLAIPGFGLRAGETGNLHAHPIDCDWAWASGHLGVF